MKTPLLATLMVIAATATATWAAEPDCGFKQLNGGRTATYCIQKPEGTNSGRVVYFLHGLGGDVRQSFDQGLTADAVSATVVTVSFGPLWLFAPEGADAPGSETMESFVEELMPQLEAQLGLPISTSTRSVVGGSMGGWNATQLYEQHADLFGRIALLCPALSEVSPYADIQEIQDYIRRTGADPVTVGRAVAVGRISFPSEEVWEDVTPFNPANLARVGPQSPPLFVSIGRQDEWGFYEGTQAYVKELETRGASVQWYPVDGPHCSFDREALERFLLG